MNLGQLRASVYTRAGIPTNDGLITPPAVNDAINEALHAIEMEEDWPWLQKNVVVSTVAGTDLYAPPADWFRTIDVRFDVTELNQPPDGTLNFYDPFELRERWALVANAAPREWSIWDDQLMLRPIPDGVYKISHTYIRPEVDLVNDSDTPLMPSNQHFALVEYAAYIVLRRDSEDPRAQQAWNAYQAWLMRDRAQRRRVDKPWRIHVRQGYEL